MLNDLALKYGTDKGSSHHNYCKVYESYLRPIKGQIELLVEIGVGGYHFANKGGESLRMWAEYLPFAKIIGVDIHEKRLRIPSSVSIHQSSQVDIDLVSVCQNADIIIDDASHINTLTIQTFKNLFPSLKPGGLYFIEDAHTSYWKENFSGDPNPEQGETVIRFFKSLVDQLSHETLLQEYKTEWAGKCEFIHFYKNLIVVKKA